MICNACGSPLHYYYHYYLLYSIRRVFSSSSYSSSCFELCYFLFAIFNFRFWIPLNASTCTRYSQSILMVCALFAICTREKEFEKNSSLLLLLLCCWYLFNGLPEKLQSKHVSLFVFRIYLSKSVQLIFIQLFGRQIISGCQSIFIHILFCLWMFKSF